MPILNINNTDLYYELHGQGQPVLLIHGLGSSARDWEFQLAALAEHFQVIVFDLRGHGRSAKPAGPYSLALFAADVAGLLQALKLNAAHIVGLSLGGGVAFQLAVDSPALVRTLTIVNSAPELVIRTWQEQLAIWQRFAIIHLMGLPKMGEVLSQRLFPKPDHVHLQKLFAERFAENDKPAYLASLRAMVGWSVTARLGEIQVPTLILTADHDYTPIAVKEAYAAKIPHATLEVISDARHAMPVECPEAFNSALLKFLLANR